MDPSSEKILYTHRLMQSGKRKDGRTNDRTKNDGRKKYHPNKTTCVTWTDAVKGAAASQRDKIIKIVLGDHSLKNNAVD